MLHPHTELRFVSEEIGYGIFATQDIPKGTITWVKDELDRSFTKEEVYSLSKPNQENLLKYTYRDREGNYFFCWDLTRYVNHSFNPNSMITALDFEIAIEDIKTGDEITNDYGTLSIIEPLEYSNGPEDREQVRPDDLLHFHAQWDSLIAEAMEDEHKVKQPLAPFLTQKQNSLLDKIRKKEIPMPSILENYYQELD